MKVYIKNYFIFSLLLVVFSTIIFITSCHKKDNELVVNGPMLVPKLPANTYQYNGGFSPLDSNINNLATLGRVLFYDRNLSLNNAISCGSCHNQQHAFADNHQFSIGLNNGYTSRNASAIFSSPNHNKFWDGRAGDYDTAVFMPVMNHLEMDIFNLNLLPGKLSQLSYYPNLFESAYGTSEINVSRIRSALASFVESFQSRNNKFDKGIQNFTAIELQGQNIFQGKGRCYSCHSGIDFNGYSTNYQNIGLEVNYLDKGRGKFTQNVNDDGKFMVPTLRNIELSAPYMHDGRYKTLREVIDHYSEGIQDSKNLSYAFRDLSGLPGSTTVPLNNPPNTFVPDNSNPLPNNPTPIVIDNLYNFPVSQLNLTEDEKKALEAFLKTFTDVSFIADPKFSNPF